MMNDRKAAVAAGLKRRLGASVAAICACAMLVGCGGETATSEPAAGDSAPADVSPPQGPGSGTPAAAETGQGPGDAERLPEEAAAASLAEGSPEADLPNQETASADEAISGLRPRVPSPVDRLPPPEEEVTPPPPRASVEAAQLAQAKSEEAGKAFMAFLESRNTDERIRWIRGGGTLRNKVEEYHTTHPQSDFKVTETQIMGAGKRLDAPTRFVFPYYVATTKNPFGFLVLIYEEPDGMKLSWEQFVLGQDYPLHEFLVRKDTTPYEFLGAITQAHIFDSDIPDEEKAKLFAVNLDLPRVALPDKPVACIDRDSAIGRMLDAVLPWGKRQLCRIGLVHDAAGKLRITSYAKLAHPN